MADVLMVLLMVAFVALCVVYVRWCDHIIGPDPVRTDGDAAEPTTRRLDEVAA